MILLDTGPLGYICHYSADERYLAARRWLKALSDRGVPIAVPEIADYELRRSLLRIPSAKSLNALDRLVVNLTYLPLDTKVMRRAAELWAFSRSQGRVTANDLALDGDVILAAQAEALERVGVPIIVATDNIRHLSWFVDARNWNEIDPSDAALDSHRHDYH